MKTLVCFLMLSGVCFGQMGEERRLKTEAIEVQNTRNDLMRQYLWQQELLRQQQWLIAQQNAQALAQANAQAAGKANAAPPVARPAAPSAAPPVYAEAPHEVSTEVELLREEVKALKEKRGVDGRSLYFQKNENRQITERYDELYRLHMKIKRMVEEGASQKALLRAFEGK